MVCDYFSRIRDLELVHLLSIELHAPRVFPKVEIQLLRVFSQRPTSSLMVSIISSTSGGIRSVISNRLHMLVGMCICLNGL